MAGNASKGRRVFRIIKNLLVELPYFNAREKLEKSKFPRSVISAYLGVFLRLLDARADILFYFANEFGFVLIIQGDAIEDVLKVVFEI